MSSQTVIFVGGSHHGRVMRVPDGRSRWSLPCGQYSMGQIADYAQRTIGINLPPFEPVVIRNAFFDESETPSESQSNRACLAIIEAFARGDLESTREKA